MAKLSTTDIFGELKVSLNAKVKTINDWLCPTQINLAALDTSGNFVEGRGLVVGYSGTDYPGIGYNVRHTATTKNFIIPMVDTASYMLATAQGFNFYSIPTGAAGRTVTLSSNPIRIVNDVVYASAFRGKDNVAGTGEAIHCPAGIYSQGTNYLYGPIITNNNRIDAGTGTFTCGTINASGIVTATGLLTANGGITTTGIDFLVTTGTNTRTLLQSVMADNDCFRILVGGTASNSGFVELATADDGTEPIYVRQYTGAFSSLTRSATLLDGSGNTSFPGVVTASSFNSMTGFDSTTPAMNGTAAVGSANTVARRDHVHPTDTTRASVGQTMYIGTTAVTINRASAELTLAGISLTAPNIGVATGTSLSATGSVIAAGGLGVNSTTGSGVGISLYNGAASGIPNYGLTFATTTTGGTHGSVTGDWATYFTVDGATNRGWVFKNGITSSGNVASISTAGTASFNGDITAFASDERLKTEFVKIENSLELTKQLDTGYYYFNDLAASFGFDSTKRQVGVKAGQLEKLLPEVVAPAPFDSGKDGSVTGENYLTVKYEKLTALLIQNIKDLTAEVEKTFVEIEKLKRGD